jgi:hypothetical protein
MEGENRNRRLPRTQQQNPLKERGLEPGMRMQQKRNTKITHMGHFGLFVSILGDSEAILAADIYTAKCATCHGTNGNGRGRHQGAGYETERRYQENPDAKNTG